MTPVDKSRSQTAEEERRARLAAALRENLKRRKAQARARRDLGAPSSAAFSGSETEADT